MIIFDYKLGAPRIRITDRTGNILKWYQLPPCNKDGVKGYYKTNAEVNTLVSNSQTVPDVKGYYPYVEIAYTVYDDSGNSGKVGVESGDILPFTELVKVLGGAPGTLQVSGGPDAPFFRCWVETLPDAKPVLNGTRFGDFKIVFRGTDCYPTPSLGGAIPDDLAGIQRLPGIPGADGLPGKDATLTIGTVNSGSTPAVYNSGTGNAAVLNFTLVPGPQGPIGLTGATGVKGDKGDTATLQIGTVATGLPGSSVSVVNVGTANDAVLNFSIPAGYKGDKGDTGLTGATGVKGDKGDTGLTGAKGDKGDVGTAASISLGTVQTGLPGTSASVTNSGSSSAAVLNFVIPQGAVGPQGPKGDPGTISNLTGANVITALGYTPASLAGSTFTSAISAPSLALTGALSLGDTNLSRLSAGELQIGSNKVFHAGNFNPANKADASHTHTVSQITDINSIAVNFTNLAVTGPITKTGTASNPVIGINLANSTTDGYLSKTDYNAFTGKLDASQKGVAGGLATLDAATGKLVDAQIPESLIGSMSYKGTWNASTNTPAIPTAATANKGSYYVVSVSGSTSVSGVTDWKVGDWIVSNGTSWDKIDSTDQVTSVAGKVGAVTLAVGDISGAAPIASPTFTGTVAAPTPATSDNSTTVATTAFVKAQNYLVSGGTITGNGSGLTNVPYSSLTGVPAISGKAKNSIIFYYETNLTTADKMAVRRIQNTGNIVKIRYYRNNVSYPGLQGTIVIYKNGVAICSVLMKTNDAHKTWIDQTATYPIAVVAGDTISAVVTVAGNNISDVTIDVECEVNLV